MTIKHLLRLLRHQRGATAVEFALVLPVFAIGCLGCIEFGRALQLRNNLSFAADFAARKVFIDSATANASLETEVRGSFVGGEPQFLQVTIGSETVDGVQFRTVTLAYPVRLLIPYLDQRALTLSVNRRTPVV